MLYKCRSNNNINIKRCRTIQHSPSCVSQRQFHRDPRGTVNPRICSIDSPPSVCGVMKSAWHRCAIRAAMKVEPERDGSGWRESIVYTPGAAARSRGANQPRITKPGEFPSFFLPRLDTSLTYLLYAVNYGLAFTAPKARWRRRSCSRCFSPLQPYGRINSRMNFSSSFNRGVTLSLSLPPTGSQRFDCVTTAAGRKKFSRRILIALFPATRRIFSYYFAFLRFFEVRSFSYIAF